MIGQYEYPNYNGAVTGTYRLTGDFMAADMYGIQKLVRDINFTPNDGRLADIAICRIYSNREDAEALLNALLTASAASSLGRKGGSVRSEKKTAASRENAKKGGWPKGKPRSQDLTPLQQQIYDLRLSGLSIREIAEQTGRQPENIRQVLGRVARKLDIPDGWAGIKKSEEV